VAPVDRSEASVRALLAQADGVDAQPVRDWQRRSLRLLREPATFDYADWCCGGLARRDER